MSDFMKSIDERTRLAGTNKLEILLFTLGHDGRTGRRETFGINVFKVREVMRTPAITAAPEMPSAVKGMVSLRGALVTAVTELPDGRLVMMLDVERALAESTSYDDGFLFKDIQPVVGQDITLLFADDSAVARGQIRRTLDALGMKSISAVNGRAAWESLQKIAEQANSTGRRVQDIVQLILIDVEMPEMDGYLLTRNIKNDPRFAGIFVIMHSSLSGMSNQKLGQSVGVDEYVPKIRTAEISRDSDPAEQATNLRSWCMMDTLGESGLS